MCVTAHCFCSPYRDEDRAILIDLKKKGPSHDTFSALSKKLKKPSGQVRSFSSLFGTVLNKVLALTVFFLSDYSQILPTHEAL